MKKLLCIVLAFQFSISLAQGPYPHAGSTDKWTVFGFSQWYLSEADTQVYFLQPNVNIRAWGKWRTDGIKKADYDFSIPSTYHQYGVDFIGGLTASVYFYEEATDSVQFRDMVTRDASNHLVPHDNIVPDAFRGNIANPAFRNYLIRIAKIQLEGGVDGLFFDEVLSGYDGSAYDGNEGFDDYHLKDFNHYLAAKYPLFTQADWVNTFGMNDSNYLNTGVSLEDLNQNFNYRSYLQSHGWQNNPFISSNPLSKEWGRNETNRVDTTVDNFVSQYNVRYWREIVDSVRSYARHSLSKEIFITSNGIFPYVDFQSLGMYDFNTDNNGAEANYIPTLNGHLNGSFSLQNVYKSLYAKSNRVTSNAPVVLFIDWPTPMIDKYNALPELEKEDYWKIYGAEAYANGLFPAFHLKTSIAGDPTAAQEGVLGFMKDYASFYRENKVFYHKNQFLNTFITSSASSINSSWMYHYSLKLHGIHLVNHNYKFASGMSQVNNFTVKLALDSMPISVSILSPDFEGMLPATFDYSSGILTITVPHLLYYNLLVIRYANTPTSIEEQNLNLSFTLFPNPSTGLVHLIKKNRENPEQDLSISISDGTGKIFLQQHVKGEQLEIQLPCGLYFVTIIEGIKTSFSKLIVL